MLVQTNGRERTEAEYHAMDATADIARFSHCRQTRGDLDVMLREVTSSTGGWDRMN